MENGINNRRFPIRSLTLHEPRVICVAQAAKRGAFELHFKAVSESLGCLNWLLVAPMPREIVEAQLGSADYSANKCVRALFRREAKRERERLWVKEAIC